MYICAVRDTLAVREIDGSQSELSLRPGPNKESSHGIYYAQVCSDDGIVVQDQSANITKYSKDGEFIWRIKSNATSPSWCFCLDSSDFLYSPTGDQVKVYFPSGAFSRDIVLFSDLKHPTAIAIDGDNNVHVGISSSSILHVFNTKGKLIRQYGHDELGEVESIAISRDNPQLVVAAEYETLQFFVFNSAGSFLYTVTGVACGVD